MFDINLKKRFLQKRKPAGDILLVAFLILACGYANGSELDLKGLRDPTQPLHYVPTSAKASKKQLKLQAIFVRSGKHEAIINGKKVRDGDSIGGAKVIRVDDSSVTYELDGQRDVLTLRKKIFTSKG